MAIQLQRPIIVMPRRSALQETRNDHQVETAIRFGAMGIVYVAMNEHDLRQRMDDLTCQCLLEPVGPHASERLLAAIRAVILSAIPDG